MLGLGGGELCLPDFGTETLPFSEAFCLQEFATRSGLWKNHLGSCDDEQGQKHYATEVIAEEVDFADSKKDAFSEYGSAFTNNECSEFKVSSDDDLPF